MNDLGLILLMKQRAKGKTGFTLPFLIGATRDTIGEIYNSEPRNYREFILLLESFQHVSSPQCIGISECVKLKEPVVALYSSSAKAREYGLDNIFLNGIGKSSTLLASSLYHKNNSFDSLVNILWKISSEHIASGNFSSEDGSYHKFSKQDYQYIKNSNK